MEKYWNIFINAYPSYFNYLWEEITNPHAKNYFYWLLAVSAVFFLLEIAKPWRKNQATFRRDFWLDFFYMFFNFFLFSLVIYNSMSDVVVKFFNDIIQAITNFDLQVSNPMRSWPYWAILLFGFLVRDFVQWNVHRLLHRIPWLWEFHKVHHSVKEMGFAAHLRYHWMENLIYRTIEYLPLALLGIGLYDFFVIHLMTLAIGHYNHSNISVKPRVSGAIFLGILSLVSVGGFFDITIWEGSMLMTKIAFVLVMITSGYFIIGPYMKKIFNSPEMHIWHHAKDIPSDRSTGINFGISLAIWDYIFGTVYWPSSGRDIVLGFEKVDEFPESFISQSKYGFGSK